MRFKKPVQQVFAQLIDSLDQISSEQYSLEIGTLSNATIGQHVRHIIELFICLDNGYQTGTVNYEKRKRDHRVETNKNLAIELLKSIYLDRMEKPNINLMLESESFDDSSETIIVPTNYFREVAYNLEHTIHHMALIRIGIEEVSAINLPNHFGVAYSTIKFREQCAQ